MKCKYCPKSLNTGRTYCSGACRSRHLSDVEVEAGRGNTRSIRRYLLQHKGEMCDRCGTVEWFHETVPLEVDHIDGNSTNNELTNLRLLCPNCHAQTPTFKARNKGKGRAIRRK